MSATRANLLMLIPPLIWGGAFVYQKTGMGSIGPFTFSFARFFFALLSNGFFISIKSLPLDSILLIGLSVIEYSGRDSILFPDSLNCIFQFQ